MRISATDLMNATIIATRNASRVKPHGEEGSCFTADAEELIQESLVPKVMRLTQESIAKVEEQHGDVEQDIALSFRTVFAMGLNIGLSLAELDNEEVEDAGKSGRT